MAKKKPRKKARKPLARGALWGAEVAEAITKAKRELGEYTRKLGLELEGNLRAGEREREEVKTTKWSRDLSWQSKPPPPEVIYMVIDGKPVRFRLTHMHNMPVYLPDDEPG